MKEIKIFFFLIIIFFPQFSLSAEKKSKVETFEGTGGRDDFSYLRAKNSNFKKGKDALKQAQKFEKKNKTEKANKRFNDAIEYFLLANNEFPDSKEILSYLGLAYNEVGDLIMAEIYFNEGLILDPKDIFLNEKLGMLYFVTERKNLAFEKLNVLKACNCQEYLNLKNFIKSR